MLNKDQYNQEEYNDYYQQEIRGAETSGFKEEESSKKGVILILLGLIILIIVGYFSYKTINSSSINETLMVQKELDKPVKTVKKVEEEPLKTKESAEEIKKEDKDVKETIQTSTEEINSSKKNEIAEVSDNIKKAIGDEEKMSPEEIAKVVQMVMSQIKNKKIEVLNQNEIKQEESASILNNELISELSNTDTDSINNEDKQLENALNNINEKTKNTSIKSDNKIIDTYNKVNVSESTGDDELSKLSNQISTLISDKSASEQIDNSKKEEVYTQSLKKEIVTRKNEMRIIVVRKGDTLGKIAKRAYGNVMEYRKIYKANPDMLKRPDRIYIGQKLRIPK